MATPGIPALALAAAVALATATPSPAAPARMQVDPALAAVEPFAVEGANPRRWGKPLDFGPYRVEAVRDADVSSFSVEVLGIGAGKAKAPYRFRLVGPDRALEAECHARGVEAWAAGVVVDVLGARGKPALMCAFRPVEGAGDWVLSLTSAGSGRYEGALFPVAEPERRATVRSVHRLERSRLPLGEPAGYALAEGDGAVAAVETINRGRVWLPEAPDSDRAARAAAAAALLLFRPAEASGD